MTHLTKQELIEIQCFLDKKIEYAESLGLKVNVDDDDLWAWRELMDSASNTGGASRTLDPMLNDVRPGNSFWINLTDRKGEIISCQANRFVETEDFVEEFVCTHRFFGNRCPSLQHYPVELQESVPVLRGRVNFGGGGWVHPDWRGNAIAGLMSRVCRVLALRHYLIDYYIGFITTTSNHRQYGRQQQGLLNQRYLLSGRYPGRDDNLDVDIYWMHRSELMNQVSRELMPSLEVVSPLTSRTA